MFSPFWWRFEYDTYYTSHKLAYMLRMQEVSNFHPSLAFHCISPYLGSDVMMLLQNLTCVSEFEEILKLFDGAKERHSVSLWMSCCGCISTFNNITPCVLNSSKNSPKHCCSLCSIKMHSGSKLCLKRQWYLPLISYENNTTAGMVIFQCYTPMAQSAKPFFQRFACISAYLHF